MWFKNKRKNRRLEAEYVLDVRLSTAAARQARVRIIGISVSLLAAVSLVCFVFWKGTEAALNAMLYENRAFAIEQIEASTDGILSVEHIRRWSLVREGENLLALDLMRVKRDLELVPYVEQAAVERVLPRKLVIRITEREPVAKVYVVHSKAGNQVENKICYLDKYGFVMPPFDAFAEAATVSTNGEALPVISGVNAGELRLGREVDSIQVKAALELLEQFETSPMSSLVEISRIDIATPDTLRVISPQGCEVLFGLKDAGPQLNRWRLVYDHFESKAMSIISLDLSVSNNSPVRLAEAALLPKPTAKTPKTNRSKKKHV